MIARLISHFIKMIAIKARKFQLERWKRHGLVVGKNLSINPGVVIDTSHCWHISIGDNVSIGPRAHILAHDGSMKKQIGYVRIGKVKIGNSVFIGSSAIILPGVTIGDNSVIGAGCVVSKDIPPNVVVAGNPARIICSIEEFAAKHRTKLETGPVFNKSYTVSGGVTEPMKKEMDEKIEAAGSGYIL